MTYDPRMRFRVWIAGRLADEAWVDTSRPDAQEHIDTTRDHHWSLVEQADRDGQVWLVEIYDPDKPEEEAYMRMGTDADGMVDPRAVT